ncbi:hypothetical protein GINT2_000608 [Glugoides intestinalis]
MDTQLEEEMNTILLLKDEETQKKSITKIIAYLLTLPLTYNSHEALFDSFILKAFEILPSSNLPFLLKSKLGEKSRRSRKVAFAGETVFVLPKEEILSQEGANQKLREAASLGITNIDTQRSFIPKQSFTAGFNYNTKLVRFISPTIRNTFLFDGNLSGNRNFKMPKMTIEQILKDIAILKEFEE